MDKIQTDALIELGASMTGLEASDIANYLEDEYPLEEAFSNVQEFHRKRIRELFEIAGFGDDDEQQIQETIKELRGIQGAYRDPEQATAVWTSPHGLVREGDLNSSRYTSTLRPTALMTRRGRGRGPQARHLRKSRRR